MGVCNSSDERREVTKMKSFTKKCCTDPISSEAFRLRAVSRKYYPNFDRLLPLEQALVFAVVIRDHWKELQGKAK